MARGGKRPGAGAKPGNLNALKTGTHSKKISQLLDNSSEALKKLIRLI